MLPRRGNRCCRAHCRSERSDERWEVPSCGAGAQPEEVHRADGHTAVTSGSGGQQQSSEGCCTDMSTRKTSTARSVMKGVPHGRTSTPLQLSVASMLTSTWDSQTARYLSRTGWTAILFKTNLPRNWCGDPKGSFPRPWNSLIQVHSVGSSNPL